MATDWAGLLNAGLNIYSALNTSSKNQTAAQNYGNFTQYNPYNLSTGNATVGFAGNNAIAALSPQFQALQGQLTQGAGGFLGGLGGLQQSGGMNPYLNNAMSAYDTNAGQPNLDGIDPRTANMGGAFNSASQGFLNGLGSFDPNQAASDYTSLLRSQAQPGNANAAQNLAQNLFNTGRLGSTGGQSMYGELINQQNQQDLGFQLAGRQYAGQEQNRLAGLSQSFGQQGDQLNQASFGRQMDLANGQFNQSNARAQQRFQNAMSLFGAGQQNLTSNIQNGLGLLQGAQGLDQGLLQAIGLGGTLGAQRSQTNQAAYAPGLDATIAKNNTSGASLVNGIGGLLDSGIFGQLADWYNGGNSYVSPGGSVGSDYWTHADPTRPGFNSAGGEAANGLSGLGQYAGNALSAYMGVQQGDAAGYASALNSLGNIAGQAGWLDTGVISNMAGTGASGGSAGWGGGGLGGYLGIFNGIKSLGKTEGKFGGTLSGAQAGYQIAGPWGALIGGLVGYAAEGGWNDANPWSASGFDGITMDSAWQDQNLARLASNPLAAVGSKLGISSDSLVGKLLDPGSFFSKKGDEKRNMKAFVEAFPGIQTEGKNNYILPDGKKIDKKQMERLAGAWYGATFHPDGDQQGWQKKFMAELSKLYPNGAESFGQ